MVARHSLSFSQHHSDTHSLPAARERGLSPAHSTQQVLQGALHAPGAVQSREPRSSAHLARHDAKLHPAPVALLCIHPVRSLQGPRETE